VSSAMGAAPPLVCLADPYWEDHSLEREIVEGAGYTYLAAPTRSWSEPPMPASDVLDVVADRRVSALLTCLAEISEDVLRACPDLRVVIRIGTGVDNIDVEAAARLGVVVGNVPDYCVEEVSDHAVAMVLAWARALLPSASAMRVGGPEPRGLQRRRMTSLTCGLVGYGRIGQATARKLTGLGARVLVNRRRPTGTNDTGQAPAVPLPELLSRSDVVILLAPLTDETNHLFDAERFALMRRGALLVNVSRGALVDTASLVAALQSGHLGAAALDVWEGEPTVPPELLGQESVILTPHVAYASDLSTAQARRSAAADVVRLLDGDAGHLLVGTSGPS
jgi:D-3-phosphoglycerate dehydrogenase